MHTIVFEDHEQLARDIPGLTPLTWSHHHFPDQESRIRIVAPVPKQVAILCGLNDANAKIFPLIMIIFYWSLQIYIRMWTLVVRFAVAQAPVGFPRVMK